jgi:catechol 2,3-dioxygenase-like lactoylglutathione lyase family enzyme
MMPRCLEVFCELYVRDLESNIKLFIDDLGFTLARAEENFAELKAGDTRLLLNSQSVSKFEAANPVREIPAGTPRGAGMEIGIVVDDLEAAYAAISGNPSLETTGVPKAVPWGGHDFRMIHPDGFYIRVASE